MEGLEITVKSFKELGFSNSTLRLDSEYFKKEYIELYKTLYIKPCEKLEILTKWITQGPNPIFQEEEGIPCLTGRNINNGRVTYENADNLSEDEYSNWKRFQIRRGDTLITLKGKGSIGKIGYVTDGRKAIFSRNIGVVRPQNINTAYVNAFILSKYGSKIVARGETGGTGQSTLAISYLKNIDIPRIGIEKEIGLLVEASEQVLIDSQKKYFQAETLLLETLGLSNFEPSAEPVNVKSFKELFLSTGRLDAEYYQPKYEEIVKAVKSNKTGYCKLEKFIKSFSTGFPYKSESYSDNGIPLIRINNIQKGELDISNAAKVPFEDIDISPKDVANENDILISMSGTIGSSCKVPKGVKALVNQRIMRITPKNIDFNVLPLIINSIIGQYQLERIGTGGVQTNISSSDIKEIIIPIIDYSIQEQIAALVEESFHLKKQSERLLETAKRAVEIAIEQNEEAAMRYIEEQSK